MRSRESDETATRRAYAASGGPSPSWLLAAAEVSDAAYSVVRVASVAGGRHRDGPAALLQARAVALGSMPAGRAPGTVSADRSRRKHRARQPAAQRGTRTGVVGQLHASAQLAHRGLDGAEAQSASGGGARFGTRREPAGEQRRLDIDAVAAGQSTRPRLARSPPSQPRARRPRCGHHHPVPFAADAKSDGGARGFAGANPGSWSLHRGRRCCE